jgi:hypothetical protein
MRKDCFRTAVVDAQKYRECAVCPIYAECTGIVDQGGARKAHAAGFALGLLVAAAGLFVAVTKWGDLPSGAPWLLFGAGAYVLALFRVFSETRAEIAETVGRLEREAEAMPEGGRPAPTEPAHGHH